MNYNIGDCYYGPNGLFQAITYYDISEIVNHPDKYRKATPEEIKGYKLNMSKKFDNADPSTNACLKLVQNDPRPYSKWKRVIKISLDNGVFLKQIELNTKEEVIKF